MREYGEQLFLFRVSRDVALFCTAALVFSGYGTSCVRRASSAARDVIRTTDCRTNVRVGLEAYAFGRTPFYSVISFAFIH